MNNDYRIVFSSDPEQNKKCKICKELLIECSCLPEENPREIKRKPVIRIEKQGRSGKTVTVIAKLPRNEQYLKALTALLKKKCGAGGTYFFKEQEGIIEIQGEKTTMVRSVLTEEGLSKNDER